MPTRILGGEVRHLRAAGDREIKTSFGVMRERHAVVVTLRSAEGLSGLGESWINFPLWAPWERIAAFEQAYLPYVEGKEVDNISRFMAGMARAFAGPAIQADTLGTLIASLCAIEGALWDLRARERNLPLSGLWFEKPAQRVAVYASGINAPLPLELIDQMLGLGVKIFKLKLGFGRDEDWKNLRELKKHLGSAAQVAVDANRAWEFDEALYWAKALGEVEARWLEEPLRPADEARYAELRQASAVPIAAGENIWIVPGDDGAALSQMGVDILQPDLTKNCGPSRALWFVRFLSRHKKRVIPHYLGSAVGQAMSLHLAAGCPEPLVEWDINPNPLRTDFFQGGFPIRDGAIEIPSEPGLGWVH
jgi:L-alanine-DL-glutamate epimerase-like enolase superfamily enzyme